MSRTASISAITFALLLFTAPLLAADIGSIVNNQPSNEGFRPISINDLAKMLADPASHVHLYDANAPQTREKEGMIPGARPLTSDDKYDVAQELPSNKKAKLVFYCHDTL